MIDAYARAVALAGTNPKHEAAKKEWVENLTTWYKYRHNNSDAGMNELVASIMSKPLPPEPTPLTSLPAAAPGASSGVGTAGSTAGGAATPAATPGAGQKPANTGPKSTTVNNPGRPR
jgi:hypothetical protein